MTSLASVAKSIASREWKKAEKQLRGLRRRFPHRPDLSYNLALVVRERGRYGDALEILAETAKRFPEYSPAPFEIANTLLALGRQTEACDRLEQYLSRWPEDADAHLLLGRIRLREGDAVLAQKHLAAMGERTGDDDHDAILLAAQIQLRCGDLDQALARFRQLSRADPGLRPGLLKELTQAPRARIPIDSRRLGWN